MVDCGRERADRVVRPHRPTSIYHVLTYGFRTRRICLRRHNCIDRHRHLPSPDSHLAHLIELKSFVGG
jgi:hypothetical protein